MSPRGPRRGRWLTLLALLIALAAPGCGRSGDVRGSGTIEMDEVDVASWVGGRVERLWVAEGDTVRAGDTLAVLDRGEVRADAEAQAAEAERAAALWRDLRSGPRAGELQAAQAERDAAESSLRLADEELKRTEALFKAQVASQAELDRARADRDAAAARNRTAAENVRLLQEGYRRNQVVAAQKATAAAQAQLRAARTRERELVLTAPVNGVVLLKNFEVGELVQPNLPVVTLGNPDSLWMRVYVGAPRIGEVRLGAPVEVRTRGAKGVFHGRVAEIATRAEFTPRAALTEEEQSNLVFGVKVVLDHSHGVLKAGLPADATFPPAGR